MRSIIGTSPQRMLMVDGAYSVPRIPKTILTIRKGNELIAVEDSVQHTRIVVFCSGERK